MWHASKMHSDMMFALSNYMLPVKLAHKPLYFINVKQVSKCKIIIVIIKLFYYKKVKHNIFVNKLFYFI